jgi:hypothetical protein
MRSQTVTSQYSSPPDIEPRNTAIHQCHFRWNSTIPVVTMSHDTSVPRFHSVAYIIDIIFLSSRTHSHAHTNRAPKNTNKKCTVNNVSQEFSFVPKKGQTRPAARTLSHPIPPLCTKKQRQTRLPELHYYHFALYHSWILGQMYVCVCMAGRRN